MQALTQLIHEWRGGSVSAEKQLFEAVYPAVKEIAARQLGRSASRTLRPTELVNDVLMTLREGAGSKINDTAHLYALSARMIRFLIVSHARQTQAEKRGGSIEFVAMENAVQDSIQAPDENLDWLGLDRALTKLSEQQPKHSELVELRYFAGMTVEEASVVMEISVPTAVRMWRFARAFLQTQLTQGAQPAI
jgi:RNA polymerase sigma factor (TIGR02999 family)